MENTKAVSQFLNGFLLYKYDYNIPTKYYRNKTQF